MALNFPSSEVKILYHQYMYIPGLGDWYSNKGQSYTCSKWFLVEIRTL